MKEERSSTFNHRAGIYFLFNDKSKQRLGAPLFPEAFQLLSPQMSIHKGGIH
jgi:hypothetical protein